MKAIDNKHFVDRKKVPDDISSFNICRSLMYVTLYISRVVDITNCSGEG